MIDSVKERRWIVQWSLESVESVFGLRWDSLLELIVDSQEA
jgi:hypothetical protein